jgi:hypothetical protein
VLTTQTAALAIVAGIGLFVLIRTVLAIAAEPDGPGTTAHWYRRLAIVGGLVGLALLGASRLEDTAILTLTQIPVEPIVLVAAIPLGYLAIGVFAGRDPRRFVVGYVAAAIAWGVILYPNIAALPLPSQIVNAYQGILPTYLYAFQFPVNTVDRTAPTPLFTPQFLLLSAMIVVTCLVIAYSAWYRRIALAEDASATASEGDGLARTGGA